MEVMQLQFLFMGVIFLVTSAVGLAPVCLKGTLSKRVKVTGDVTSRLLSCASCFGAGVFLFVCFLGLLPAADTKFHHFLGKLGNSQEWESFAQFPWGFFVVTCGFLVIFTIDKLVHAIEHSRDARESTALLPRRPGAAQGTTDTEATCPDAQYHCQAEHSGHGVPSSVIFLVALGLHSVFEGVAVGLQTEHDKVLEFSVAVLVHEAVMAFTFGMEVSRSPLLSRVGQAVYVVLFTATIPVGIGGGVALQNTSSQHREIVSAVLEAFATGIFIHVIFVEILAKEFPSHQHRRSHKGVEGEGASETWRLLEKIIAICCGLLTLILLNVFMHGHDHGMDHGADHGLDHGTDYDLDHALDHEH